MLVKKNLKKIFALIKADMLAAVYFRLNYFTVFVGNIFYLIIVYSLWRGIYATCQVTYINGMSFDDTMVYLVLAMAIHNSVDTYIAWSLAENIKTGEIVVSLIKPIDLQVYEFFSVFGEVLQNILISFCPVLLLLIMITKDRIALGSNIVLFFLSMLIAIIINYCIDFSIGCIAFMSESVRGISAFKETVVLFFSGAMIPLAFFPDCYQKIIQYSPFAAFYNIPIEILLNHTYEIYDYLKYFGIQLLWLVVFVVISRWVFRTTKIRIVCNGG